MSRPRPDEEELLDTPHLPLEERERALRDLSRSNRLLLGNRATVKSLVPRLPQGHRALVVDVGTGSGDVLADLKRRAAARGRAILPVGVDRQLSHLVIGRRWHPGHPRVVADAAALPFRDRGVDWSLSTLFFHHLDAASKSRCLAEMGRVAGREVVIIDLHRSPWLSWLIRLLLPLLGVGRTARHDGILSAARASSLQEIRALLPTEWSGELRRLFPCRFSLVLAVPEDSRPLPEGPGSGR